MESKKRLAGGQWGMKIEWQRSSEEWREMHCEGEGRRYRG